MAQDPLALARESRANALARPARGGLRRFFSQNGTLLLMASPGLLLFFVFSYLPMFGIIIAFKNYRFNKGILGSDWVGLQNFRYLFGTTAAWRITYNTLLMNFLFIVTTTVGALVVALLLNEIQEARLARVYQSALFFPHFVSYVIVGCFVFAFLSTENGLVNKLLISLGQQPVMWYASPQHWPGILTITHLWKSVGFSSIIYLAGMLGISPELYEAARIDGATRLRQIWHITLPLLSPLIVIQTLLAIGRIFYADFGLFFNVTRDSPQLYPTTDVIDTYVYRALRELGDIGMASAAGFYQAIVGFILVLLSNWIVKRVDPDKSLF
jgi:putative aldouronate transport system permease protein